MKLCTIIFKFLNKYKYTTFVWSITFFKFIVIFNKTQSITIYFTFPAKCWLLYKTPGQLYRKHN